MRFPFLITLLAACHDTTAAQPQLEFADGQRLTAGGARTNITLHLGNRSATRVASTDETVATFFLASASSVEMLTGQPGSVQLEVYDSTDELLAVSPQISVEAPAALRSDQGWPSGQNPRVVAGEPASLHVTAYASDGIALGGSGAVRFSLDGTLVSLTRPLDGDELPFTGTPGGGTITASSSSASTAVDISVVARDEVTAVTMTSGALTDDTFVVTATAQTHDGSVYTGACAWSADPAVTLASDIGPTLELGPGEMAVFHVASPGRYTITCEVAGQRSEVAIVRQ
jgi:hypothetical protein